MVAWEVQWFDEDLLAYQKELCEWTRKLKLKCDDRSWLCHATICRNPFDAKKWEEDFKPLPCFAKAIHLYQSLGSSNYKSLWSFPLLAPFEEIPHTADIAFRIVGKDLNHLYANAFTALAFKCPRFLAYFQKPSSLTCLDDVIIELNKVICILDQKEGCPLKAVSFHGEIEPFEENLLQWEMIVDI